MARRWSGGRDTAKEDLAAFGLIDAEEDETKMEVWPENLETVSVFMALETQWMISDRNIYRLNYQSVQSVMVMMGVKRYKWPEVFSGIHTMEQAAMQILNAKNG